MQNAIYGSLGLLIGLPVAGEYMEQFA